MQSESDDRAVAKRCADHDISSEGCAWRADLAETVAVS